ncbi:MAG: TetR/AcrR family transcriptional regulator [Candidatus Thorarchaeota archaeon]
MSAKPKKFTRDKESKINSILKATVDLIEEKGYSSFTVDDIPKRASLSIGTVYRYFPNGKSDILHEIITRNNRVLMEMINLRDSHEGSFYDFWRHVIDSYLRGHREAKFSLTAIEYSLGGDTQFTNILRPILMDFFQKLVSIVSEFGTFSALSQKELYSRVAMAFGVAGLFVKSHVRSSLFKSDEKLVDYLIEVSRITFEMES